MAQVSAVDWEIELAVRVEHPVLHCHFDFVSTARMSLRLMIGVFKKIEACQTCIDIESGDSQSMIVEP